MKRIYSILVGISLLVVIGGSVTSCSDSDDNDFSSDPNYKGPTFVSLTLPDTTRVETQNIIATLDVNGEFDLELELDNKTQLFAFKVLKFQEANFPVNLNPIQYDIKTNDTDYDNFSSQDLNDPTRNNGMIKITKIDYEAMLVSGTFSSSMVPMPFNTVGIKTFHLSGEFKNIPYKRVGHKGKNGFVYASVNNQEIKDLGVVSDKNGDIVENKIVIFAESELMRKRDIKISFVKEAVAGTYGYDQVEVEYTSENGVKYYSSNIDKDLAGSSMKIEGISSLPGIPNRKSYSGKFTFKLKSKTGDVITLNFGDFYADLLMKEVTVIPTPGPVIPKL